MLYVSSGKNLVEATLNLPKSKSEANRFLILDFLYRCGLPPNLGEARDTSILKRAITQAKTTGIVNVEDAGTAMRFLTAALAVSPGQYQVFGTARMHERPLLPLITALRELGADIRCITQEGFAPLHITGKLLSATKVNINGSISSQFISALMMIGPLLHNPFYINTNGPLVSRPYMLQTAKVMQYIGCQVDVGANQLIISGSPKPQAEQHQIEPDWSSLAYWYCIIALSEKPLEIRFNDFKTGSVQADAICESLFSQLGVQTVYHHEGLTLKSQALKSDYFSWNCTDCPDLVPALICCCAALGIPAKLSGIAHLAYKESNRIACLKRELSRQGCQIHYEADTLFLAHSQIQPSCITINSYQDHRLILCFMPWLIRGWHFEIPDPETVNKSYPQFWSHLKTVGFNVLLS
ncbi:MAG: 3-phosphoshikimate 1-carboxyvinyltransferase [Bacteroidia bacterium]|jgi:3-phosphoshikimate 1-carboxyvinyltransferase